MPLVINSKANFYVRYLILIPLLVILAFSAMLFYFENKYNSASSTMRKSCLIEVSDKNSSKVKEIYVDVVVRISLNQRLVLLRFNVIGQNIQEAIKIWQISSPYVPLEPRVNVLDKILKNETPQLLIHYLQMRALSFYPFIKGEIPLDNLIMCNKGYRVKINMTIDSGKSEILDVAISSFGIKRNGRYIGIDWCGLDINFLLLQSSIIVIVLLLSAILPFVNDTLRIVLGGLFPLFIIEINLVLAIPGKIVFTHTLPFPIIWFLSFLFSYSLVAHLVESYLSKGCSNEKESEKIEKIRKYTCIKIWLLIITFLMLIILSLVQALKVETWDFFYLTIILISFSLIAILIIDYFNCFKLLLDAVKKRLNIKLK